VLDGLQRDRATAGAERRDVFAREPARDSVCEGLFLRGRGHGDSMKGSCKDQHEPLRLVRQGIVTD
jgi:hypothetical protein